MNVMNAVVSLHDVFGYEPEQFWKSSWLAVRQCGQLRKEINTLMPGGGDSALGLDRARVRVRVRRGGP